MPKIKPHMQTNTNTHTQSIHKLNHIAQFKVFHINNNNDKIEMFITFYVFLVVPDDVSNNHIENTKNIHC